MGLVFRFALLRLDSSRGVVEGVSDSPLELSSPSMIIISLDLVFVGSTFEGRVSFFVLPNTGLILPVTHLKCHPTHLAFLFSAEQDNLSS